MRRLTFTILTVFISFSFLSFKGVIPQSPASIKLATDTLDLKARDIKNIVIKIYKAAHDGKIKAYKDGKLKETFTLDQVKKIGGFCETVQISVNPNNPYETKDSTVCNEFDQEGLNAFLWQLDAQNAPEAFGPAYQASVNGVMLPYTPMFYVKFEDVKSVLSEMELITLTHAAEVLPGSPFE